MTNEELILEKIETLIKKVKTTAYPDYYPAGEVNDLLDSIENYSNDKYLMGKKGIENSTRIGHHL